MILALIKYLPFNVVCFTSGFENGNPNAKHFGSKCGLIWIFFPTKGNP
jgi:hypothetical protein